MYDQHTRGMAITRHMSLVGRGGTKIFVRDKGLAHTQWDVFWYSFWIFRDFVTKGLLCDCLSRRSGGYCVSISRGSGESEITMQLSCLKSKPNIRRLHKETHLKSLVGAAGFWVLEKHKKPVHARRQAGDQRSRGGPLVAPRARPLRLAADLRR